MFLKIRGFRFRIDRMNILPLMIYHKMNLMSCPMPLRLHWWSKNFFKSSSLDTFWHNVVLSVDLKIKLNLSVVKIMMCMYILFIKLTSLRCCRTFGSPIGFNCGTDCEYSVFGMIAALYNIKVRTGFYTTPKHALY